MRCLVRINGNECEGMTGLTIDEMLEKQGFGGMYVVVEVNEEIIDREEFTTHLIYDGDVIEVVRFVGGG